MSSVYSTVRSLAGAIAAPFRHRQRRADLQTAHDPIATPYNPSPINKPHNCGVATVPCPPPTSSGTAGDWFARGCRFKNKRDYDSAIYCFERSLELDPDLVDAMLERGIAYVSKSDYDHAKRDLEQVIQLRPDAPTAYIYRGIIFLHPITSDPDRCINDATHAILLQETNYAAYGIRARAYAKKGEFRLCIADLTNAIANCHDANRWSYYSDRADAHWKLSEYDKANTDYSAAIKVDPSIALTFYNRARTYAAMGMSKEALADLQEARRLPLNVESRNAFELLTEQDWKRFQLDFVQAVGDDHHFAGLEKC
jgi:tetratricopeptide (TPR) repeat protein